MAINSKKYSLWLSTVPWSTLLTDSNFMFIGNSDSLPYEITYNSTTLGILTQPPSTAVFTDGVGGAVARMNVSATRAITTDCSDPPSISGDVTNVSCRFMIDAITKMKSKAQMLNNAYVLRIYNVFRTPGEYRELYVYVGDSTFSIELAEPQALSVNINFIQRNKLVGFNQ